MTYNFKERNLNQLALVQMTKPLHSTRKFCQTVFLPKLPPMEKCLGARAPQSTPNDVKQIPLFSLHPSSLYLSLLSLSFTSLQVKIEMIYIRRCSTIGLHCIKKEERFWYKKHPIPQKIAVLSKIMKTTLVFISSYFVIIMSQF